MKRFLLAAAIAANTAAIAGDAGVSIRIGQPGFFGRLDMRDYPPPRLIYERPKMVERMTMERAPVYLRVPPGHAKNWRKHCRKYHACGERAYFVQDSWYKHEYVPRHQERHGDRRGDGRGPRRYDRLAEMYYRPANEHHQGHKH